MTHNNCKHTRQVHVKRKHYNSTHIRDPECVHREIYQSCENISLSDWHSYNQEKSKTRWAYQTDEMIRYFEILYTVQDVVQK